MRKSTKIERVLRFIAITGMVIILLFILRPTANASQAKGWINYPDNPKVISKPKINVKVKPEIEETRQFMCFKGFSFIIVRNSSGERVYKIYTQIVIDYDGKRQLEIKPHKCI